MISKNSYKFLYLFLYLFILIILNFPHEGHAQIFLSEDWDSGTPPTAWPCKNLPNAITTATFNGWMGRDFLVDNSAYDGGKLSGLSTSIYHSAPRSYYQHRPANDYWTCDISKSLPQPYPTKIHLRFYVYFTNNWLGFDNPPASTYEATHFIFTNTALSGTGFRFNIDDHVSGAYPYECNNDQAFSGMYFEIENGSNAGRRGTAPYDCYNLRNNLNRWQCVEFMVDTANGDGTVDGPYGTKNGRYSQWIDGDLKVNYVSTPVSQANFTKIIISGFSSFLRDFTGDFYIDDIVVSDSYIGCSDGGGDTQAPTVPANLSAQAISSSQINLSWTASTDNVGVAGYRIYRNNTQVATTANTSYSDTGLSPSTTYTYTVSADDIANNVSAQSNSASAATAANTGGNTGGSGGDASGGSGCGFVKDDGKGQGAKGEGLSFMLMLIITLTAIAIARRFSNRFSYNL